MEILRRLRQERRRRGARSTSGSTGAGGAVHPRGLRRGGAPRRRTTSSTSSLRIRRGARAARRRVRPDWRGPAAARVPGLRGARGVGIARPLPDVRSGPRTPGPSCTRRGPPGRPKGAMRSHQSYALFYLLNAIEFGFGRDDVGLAVMPHVPRELRVLRRSCSRTWAPPSACTTAKSFDPEHLLGVLADGADHLHLARADPLRDDARPRRRRCANATTSGRSRSSSSPPLRRAARRSWPMMEAFPNARLFEAYGSTEAGLVTLLRPEQQFDKLGSIGREIVGTGRIRLLDSGRSGGGRGRGRRAVRAHAHRLRRLLEPPRGDRARVPRGVLQRG